MQRSLGEGTISKLLKCYAFIQEERLGKVYFPIASYLTTSTCADLRDVFQEGDEIIFTAKRQSPPQADCRYVACSVVKKSQLIPVTGRITEKSEKYAYAEAPRVGRIFLPYSARNMNTNKPWLGRGIVEGARYDLKIMPQPEVSGCSFVAWAINVSGESIDEDVPLYRQNYLRLERQPEVIEKQIGIVISSDQDSSEAYVYATQTGMARVPFLVSPTGIVVEQGVWMRYSVMKADHPSKYTWVARDVEFIGYLMKLNDKCLLPGPCALSLLTKAVVCRISETHGAAWLWNDLLGRIYVSGEEYMKGMRCLSAVRLRVEYTGNFEDVPWSGYDLEVLENDTEVTLQNVAQLLQTDDQWRVTYVKEQESYYGFMENPKFGSAFIAWTDTTRGEDPPEKGSLCRATVYKQYRDRKHQWRAVLVTPLDNAGRPKFAHPFRKPGSTLRIPTGNYVPRGRVDPTKKPELPSPPPKAETPARKEENLRSLSNNGIANNTSLDPGRMNKVLSVQEQPKVEEPPVLPPIHANYNFYGEDLGTANDSYKGGLYGAIGSNKTSSGVKKPYLVGEINGTRKPSNGFCESLGSMDGLGDNLLSFDSIPTLAEFEAHTDFGVPRYSPEGSINCSSPAFPLTESPFSLSENGPNGLQKKENPFNFEDFINGLRGGAKEDDNPTWSYGGSNGLSLFSFPPKTEALAPPPGLPPPFGSRLRYSNGTTSTTPSMSSESLAENLHFGAINGTYSSATPSRVDVSTQTEVLIEQEMIRKVTRCEKAISQLAEECPEFFAMILQIKWQQV
ncbi:hypothetical protein L596_002889 [Steinernema carpocapsae]|uniref:Uncharacterized protein n=1 Tax=Steinernema carpocapsae TaxID=34508 RepID=A0A4U8UTL1_STECR|nr:hypothetical protein L596_002889 [Steinernema carpocapsae]